MSFIQPVPSQMPQGPSQPYYQQANIPAPNPAVMNQVMANNLESSPYQQEPAQAPVTQNNTNTTSATNNTVKTVTSPTSVKRVNGITIHHHHTSNTSHKPIKKHEIKNSLVHHQWTAKQQEIAKEYEKFTGSKLHPVPGENNKVKYQIKGKNTFQKRSWEEIEKYVAHKKSSLKK